MVSKTLQLCSLLFVLLLAMGGCNEANQFRNGTCADRSDCPIGAACRGGLCACISDEACAAGEECNSQGLCQRLSGCRRNDQCPDPQQTFCDLLTGTCIDRVSLDNSGVLAGCGSNVHCEPGHVCDSARKVCVEGCYEDADCPLFRVCQGAANGQAGVCTAGNCSDNSFCEYGQFCTSNGCIDSPDPNHCAPCTNESLGECGSLSNYCLINPYYDEEDPDPALGSQYYCGVDCANNPDICPNGYNCNSVQILTQAICTENSDCCDPSNSDECCLDDELNCPSTKRQCSKGEGAPTGGCTCLTTEDCRIDELRPFCANTCQRTGQICGQDSDCKTCGGLGLTGCSEDSDCLALPCQMTSGDSCSSTNKQCQWPLNTTCNTDTDCEPLPFCVPLQGTQTCIWDIGGTQCNTNADCMCNRNTGVCMGTGRPCQTGADCQLSCQNGACLLGASCGPNEGLVCPELIR